MNKNCIANRFIREPSGNRSWGNACGQIKYFKIAG